LWKFSNIISAASVDDDRCAEEVRKSLEACDLEEAVYKFIASNKTGEKRWVQCCKSFEENKLINESFTE